MSQALDPVTQHHVRQAADALGEEFAGVFSRETIERYIAESVDLLGRAGSTCSCPCSRIASRERLKASPRREGLATKEMPEVLFVCVHNAGRSQMAAGLVKLRSEGRIHVRSTSSAPGDEINRRRRRDGGARHRHERGVPQAPHRRGRARRGRRDHDGLRRRLSDLPREALRGLGARRPRGSGRRHRPPDPRRDRREGPDPSSEAPCPDRSPGAASPRRSRPSCSSSPAAAQSSPTPSATPVSGRTASPSRSGSRSPR